MTVALTVNGVSFDFPEDAEESWGDDVTSWASAITTGMLQKAGGTFTLTGEVDLGATYSFKAPYFKSRTANPASGGFIRLAQADSIKWRNNANNADLALDVSSDVLRWAGSSILLAGVASIVNADVATGAAIAYSKLAALTASRALVSDGSGVISASAVTATEAGYLAGVTSAVQTQLDGKQPLDADLTALAAFSSTGLAARTASNTWAQRSVAVGSAKLTVSNGDGVSGNPTLDLGSVTGSTGLVAQTAAGTYAARTLTAGSSKVAVTNGDGVSGNPTVDVTEANLTHDNIGGTLGIAKGGTGQTTAAAAFKALAAYSAKGDTVGYDGSAAGRLAIGVDGTVLTADAASTYGFKWATALVNPMTAAQDVIVGGSAGAATRLDTTRLGDIQVAPTGTATVTMTIATPCVVTLSSHGLATGDKVYLTTTGALPTGLSASTTYYVVNVSSSTFSLATSLANAVAGTKIATSGSQSGTHTLAYGGLVLTSGVKGTLTNDTPTAGYVGEVQTISRLRSNATSLTTGTTVNVGTTSSITLTPGHWVVSGMTSYRPAASTSITVLNTAISATSATLPGTDTISVPTSGEVWAPWGSSADVPGNGNDKTIAIPPYDVYVAAGATKTLYLVAVATFTVSTLQVFGSMTARRVR